VTFEHDEVSETLPTTKLNRRVDVELVEVLTWGLGIMPADSVSVAAGKRDGHSFELG